MTEFTKPRFSVKTGKRPERDCSLAGHWPRLTRHGYECTFCGKACKVDGRAFGDEGEK